MRMARNHRRKRRRAIGLTAGALAGLLVFLPIRPLATNDGEAVILLMPVAFGIALWVGWPRVRRVSTGKAIFYLSVVGATIWGAIWFAAMAAGGRVKLIEICLALYFFAGWRLGWALWCRTTGQLGEKYRRWGRRKRYQVRAVIPPPGIRVRLTYGWPSLIAPARFLITACMFFPFFLGSMNHRVKIGNPPIDSLQTPLITEEVSFVAADGLTLSGWYVDAPGSDSVVIVCHGSGANKANFLPFLEVVCSGGRFSGLIFDFRGHGESDGHTTSFGLHEVRDIKAAVDWLKQAREPRAVHVYGIGSSMGAMALVRAAAVDDRIEAIILDSCFVSAEILVHDFAKRLPVLGPLMAEVGKASASFWSDGSIADIDGVEAIKGLSPRPVFLIHGENDLFIDRYHAELLFEAAHEPKSLWIGPGAHSNILTAVPQDFQSRVMGFLLELDGESSESQSIDPR
jgi:fermentation-respiration switch protein FrsA (DUF1100 family)